MKVLVTGASGFIGRALCTRFFEEEGVHLVATSRSSGQAAGGVPIAATDLGADTDWQGLLDSVDVVVHTAARVHVTRDSENLSEFRRVNVDGTLNLARQAADCGVRRFVFLSSVKVNGENTRPGHAYSADDQPAPVDAYSRSKYEAETALSSLANESGMETVIIRPPLVYGPGVKANFLALMRWIHRGYPSPIARLQNVRSLIGLENLVDLVFNCCTHPRAANEIFMAADDEDISTRELVIRLGAALNKPARLFAVHPSLLAATAALAGKRAQFDKLAGNLQLDIRKTRSVLGWHPAVPLDRQLESTVNYFLGNQR